MKKIMYNDKFGLTDSVLQGRKTVTRRLVVSRTGFFQVCSKYGIVTNIWQTDANEWTGENLIPVKPHYQIGEIVAIAQRYRESIDSNVYNGLSMRNFAKSAGWTNKMFVKAGLMPHQIEMLDIRVERLQDITDEDCIKEGIVSFTKDESICKYGIDGWKWQDMQCTPREAFAFLIDKVSGKGTWKSNPYVFRYEFKLIK